MHFYPEINKKKHFAFLKNDQDFQNDKKINVI